MTILSKILSSKIRAEIFRLLFDTHSAELHMREIERQTGFAIGTIQTEFKKLVSLDLVIKRRDGNRAYFSANQDHPLYPEIHRLVLKTNGLVDIFKDVMQPVKEIRVAFIFGSIAEKKEQASSDVDIMIIADFGLRRCMQIITGVSEKIGREINPHILTESEFAKRIQKQDHFLTQVMNSSKLFIIGNENDLAKLG